MNSTSDIINCLGPDAIQEACQVGEFSIRAAKRDGKFPASWFDAIEGLCTARDMACPRELFAFKRPLEVPPAQYPLAEVREGGL